MESDSILPDERTAVSSFPGTDRRHQLTGLFDGVKPRAVEVGEEAAKAPRIDRNTQLSTRQEYLTMQFSIHLQSIGCRSLLRCHAGSNTTFVLRFPSDAQVRMATVGMDANQKSLPEFSENPEHSKSSKFGCVF
jgi:hypothetical protein